MGEKVGRFLRNDVVDSPSFEAVVDDLKARRLNYMGEEVAPPAELTAIQIEKGLPPRGHGGSVDVLPFLRGRTRFLMEHPLENLRPESERVPVKLQAKVHIK